MEDERGAHLGAGVLDRIGQPFDDPLRQLVTVLLAAAQVVKEFEQVAAFARLGLGRPAAPQVAADGLVGAGGVEADFGQAHDLALLAQLPLAPAVVGDDVHHVLLGDQQMLLVIEQRALAAIDQRKALAGFVDRQQADQILLGRQFPLPPGDSRPRGRGRPSERCEPRLDLLAHDMDAFLDVQIVKVGAIFFLFSFR